MAEINAGSDVDAYCSKCKLVLAHVVIAMRGSKPARVECKTCKGVHAYKATATTKKSTRAKRAATKSANDYEAMMEGRDISQAIKYRASQSFEEHDIMDHKTFGIGLVMRMLDDKKLEVMFQTGTKVLVHSR